MRQSGTRHILIINLFQQIASCSLLVDDTNFPDQFLLMINDFLADFCI